MLVCHRPGTNTSQLFRLQREGGELVPLTQLSDDAVTSGCYEPIHGKHAVFERSRGGNEEVSLNWRQPIFIVDAAVYSVFIFRRSSTERV